MRSLYIFTCEKSEIDIAIIAIHVVQGHRTARPRGGSWLGDDPECFGNVKWRTFTGIFVGCIG